MNIMKDFDSKTVNMKITPFVRAIQKNNATKSTTHTINKEAMTTEDYEVTALEVLVFKTNLHSHTDVLRITSALDQLPGVLRWNVDLQDVDHVLRIESRNLPTAVVKGALNCAGYLCDELTD